jgi:hypothetical protein
MAGMGDNFLLGFYVVYFVAFLGILKFLSARNHAA